ncbi:MAG: hypothetical protein Q8O93_01920 [bacterium]|nr:hypothetical protein [bacterium]
MIKRIVKYSLAIVLLSIALAGWPGSAVNQPSVVQAAGWWEVAQEGGLDQAGRPFGEPRDVRQVVADIIKVILGFLGIIFTGLIIFAGFKWMTAGGNEESVAGAKKLLINSVIGLTVILAAYMIANFVIAAIAESIKDK